MQHKTKPITNKPKKCIMLISQLLSERKDICQEHLWTSGPFLNALRRPAGHLRDAGLEDWKLCFWMPIRVPGDTWSPNSPLPLVSSLLFLLSGGSECSGLHVLNRCVGIGENIKVKTKGAQKTPGSSATCVSIYVRESQAWRAFLHMQVCVSVKKAGICIHTLCACVHFSCIYMHCMFILHFVGVISQ